MKAMIFEKYGAPDVLYLKEVKQPVPNDDEVLVKVHATAINEWDWGLLHGKPFANRAMFGLFKPKKINILGCDIAGEVVAVGNNVKKYQIGDQVFGDISSGKWGGFAEYVCASENALTQKPAGMSYEQAAAIPQAGLLAFQGLQKGLAQQAKSILINGASGGAGTIAMQIAKSYGAEITGVCRTKKMDFVRSMGADHVIDYTQEDFTKNGQSYDLILDVMAHHSLIDYRRSLKANGRYVALGGGTFPMLQVIFLGSLLSKFSNKKTELLFLKPNKDMEALVKLFEEGKVTPVIDRCYPLEELVEAFNYYGEGNAMGKVTIRMNK